MEILLKTCHDYHEGDNMERLDLYKCDICGNVVEIILNGNGELVCCGQPMKKMEAQNQEEAMMEKHIPVFVSLDDNSQEVRVGEVLHPMLPEHYIMFIEAISQDRNRVQLQFLHPGEEPKMILKEKFGDTLAREYCSIHGLWQSK